MAARPSVTPTQQAQDLRVRAGAALAAQDWAILLYCVAVALIVMAHGGPHRWQSVGWLALDAALAGGGILAYRGGLVTGRAGLALYRAALVGAVLGAYLQLQVILRDFAAHVRDAELLAVDEWLFGTTPALLLEQVATRWVTEWFAFFYFGYFLLLAAYVLPLVASPRDDDATEELTRGLVLLYCSAQVLYFVVPAFGPYQHVAARFAAPLPGGFFWRIVQETVEGAGAKLDVFPSLHTGGPVFLSLYAFGRRKERFFARAWIPTAFVAVQIVIATVYLRWHYTIDAVAGIALATLVWRLGRARIGAKRASSPLHG